MASGKYTNIERITEILGSDGISVLFKKAQGTEKKANDLLKRIAELEENARQRALQSAAAQESPQDAQEPSPEKTVNAEPETAEKNAEKNPETASEAARAETKPAENRKESTGGQTETPEAVTEAAAEGLLSGETSVRKEEPEAAKPRGEAAVPEKPAENRSASGAGAVRQEEPMRKPASPRNDGKSAERKNGAEQQGAGYVRTERNGEESIRIRQPIRERSQQQKPQGQGVSGTQTRNTYVSGEGRRNSDTLFRENGQRGQGEQRYSGGYASRQGQTGYVGQGDRPGTRRSGQYVSRDQGQRVDRPVKTPYGQTRPQQGAGYGTRPAGGQRMQSASSSRGGAKFNPDSAPVVPPVSGKGQLPQKKKTYEKTYTEQKHTLNKRALVKQQVSASDFDEDKSGYRKLRVKKQKTAATQTIHIEHAVVTTENIPLKVLSEKLGITAVEITKRLFKEGIMKTINDTLDYDTAAYVASDLGIELEYRPEKTAEELLSEIYKTENESTGGEGYVVRPPVVTVMGHVDHGKTSLLDRIRQTNVTAGEAGGITQHIGAYTVTVGDKSITFLDTPGHEAFTAMRARGASVTDIVVLVIAADDGIMPQTVEAINHSKAAGVPIIVAVNKMDKPGADLERIRRELVNNGLTPEEWGGETIVCPVSAKTGEGIGELLETINLVAEVRELKANPNSMARGTIIEAKLDKGKGPVASVLIQNGTLHTGDNVISGTTIGRVRAMLDDKGRMVKTAGPSMAVSIIGLEEVPNARDSIIAVEQDKLMKQVAGERRRKESELLQKEQTRVTLDDVFEKIAEGKIKGLNIIIKADVQGSVEAVKQSLLKLSNDEVRVNVLHAAAGAITESDVSLADSSNAIIVGFNVRPDTKAKALAEKSRVDVRTYRIIYELLDDIQAALKGMLAPKYREVMTGKCDVLQTFRITGVGMVAGCYVTEGKLVRNGKLRIYRDNIMIVEGSVRQLKRFKDDVKEVSGGFECGVSIDGFDGIQIGDVIECYITEEIPS